MLLKHERNNGLGMDALVSGCSWNTNGIMDLAWMLWSPHALETRTLLWFGHGCSGHRMHGMVWPWTKSAYIYLEHPSKPKNLEIDTKI